MEDSLSKIPKIEAKEARESFKEPEFQNNLKQNENNTKNKNDSTSKYEYNYRHKYINTSFDIFITKIILIIIYFIICLFTLIYI